MIKQTFLDLKKTQRRVFDVKNIYFFLIDNYIYIIALKLIFTLKRNINSILIMNIVAKIGQELFIK